MAPETMVAAVAANTSWKKNLLNRGTFAQLIGSKFDVGTMTPSSLATSTIFSSSMNPLVPMKSLPIENITPKPTSQNMMLPKLKSSRFFMQMLATFLARVSPASTRQKPACMNMTRKAATITQTVSRATLIDPSDSFKPMVGPGIASSSSSSLGSFGIGRSFLLDLRVDDNLALGRGLFRILCPTSCGHRKQGCGHH